MLFFPCLFKVRLVLRRINWSILGYIFWIFIMANIVAGIAHANDNDSNAINWAFQVGLGDGFSIGTQENANVYKLPFSYTTRHLRDYEWGLKLKFPLTVGVYNIETADKDIDLDVLAIVPGIELQIPVRDNWILIPLLNFGLGKNTSGGDLQYLYSVGIKHHVFFGWKNLDFTFGNTLRNDGYFTDGNDNSDNVPLFSTYLDMRFPLGFNLLNKSGYLSLYAINYYYFDDVTVIDSETIPIEVDTQWELGITFSSIPSWKFWFFEIERVGLGYRFGDGFSAIRLVFGMPF